MFELESLGKLSLPIRKGYLCKIHNFKPFYIKILWNDGDNTKWVLDKCEFCGRIYSFTEWSWLCLRTGTQYVYDLLKGDIFIDQTLPKQERYAFKVIGGS